MTIAFDPVTVINMALCILILLLGCLGYKKMRINFLFLSV